VTEREIRRIIAEVCSELDRRARAVGRVVGPSVVGASLALGIAGCDDRSAPLYSAPAPDGKLDVKKTADGGPGDVRPHWEYPPMPPYGVPNPDAAYMGPFPDLAVKKDTLKLDKGPPVPPYMAPDVGPPTPDYMVPFDGGVAPLYTAPPKFDK
jgi:hypothetical protein